MNLPYQRYPTLRQKLNRSVIAIASVIVLTVPILYFLTSHYYEETQLARDLDRDVEFLSEMAFKSPDMWRYQESRIAVGLSKDFTENIITLKTVMDSNENIVVVVGDKPHRFNIEHDTPLFSGFIQIEHQLRQSQKLEAVGQLSAGIAHDFNNMLGVIEGNVELWSLSDTSENAKKHVIRIQAAAASGANLTHRLLAFSRQQPLRCCYCQIGSRSTSEYPAIAF